MITFRFVLLVSVLAWIQVDLIQSHCNDQEVSGKYNGVGIVENIVKSENDKRTYRGLVFENGFEALLISDENTTSSAMSISVDVGSYQDDPLLQGQAHLYEHMCFLGTKNYPGDTSWTNYMAENQGSYNAYTSAYETQYYFSISNDKFSETSLRFIDFFVNPLMNPNKIESEVEAVNSECNRFKDEDTRKIRMVNKATCDQKHPFSKFDIGNTETLVTNAKKLKINVHQKLLDFHKKYYVGTAMKSVIYSSLPIEELTKFTVDSLPIKQIVKGDHQRQVISSHFFRQEHLGKVIKIVSKESKETINLCFPIRSFQWENKGEHATDLLAKLLSSEHEGSLVQMLKSKQLITSFSAYESMYSYGHSLFTVNIAVTSTGMSKYDEIVTMFYQYLGFLSESIKQKGKHFYNEIKCIDRNDFKYQEPVEAESTVKEYASLMQSFSFSEVLINYSNYNQYSQKIMDELIGKLTPQRMRVSLLSQSFAQQAKSTEKYLGVKYSVENIDKSTLAKWSSKMSKYAEKVKSNDAKCKYSFPKPNMFIQTDMKLKEIKDATISLPQIVSNNEHHRTWLLQDTQYRVPSAYYSFIVRSEECGASAKSRVSTKLMVKMIDDRLKTKLYQAKLVGQWHRLDVIENGFWFDSYGYDTNLKYFLEAFTAELMDFKVDNFEAVRKQFEVDLKNSDNIEVSQLCSNYLQTMLVRESMSSEEQLASLKEVTRESFSDFYSKVFQKMHVESLAYGNVRVDTNEVDFAKATKKITAGCTQSMKTDALKVSQTVKLQDNQWYLYQKQVTQNTNNAILNFYPIGEESPQNIAISYFFFELLRERYYQDIRHKQKLGYKLYLSMATYGNVVGLEVFLESSHNMSQIDESLEKFVQEQLKFIQEMDAQAFDTVRKNVKVGLSEQMKDLEQSGQRLAAICKKSKYTFNSQEERTKAFEAITRDQLIQCYRTNLKEKSRKVSIQILGKGAQATAHNEKYKKLASVTELKKHCTSYEQYKYKQVELSSEVKTVESSSAKK